MGGSRKSRPSFLQSLVLEVDLRADAEVTTHDVRTSPGRIEAEQAIGRVGIERRLGVEQVEHVRIDGELVTDLLRHGQVKIPDILRLAVDRSLIDISVRRRAIGSIICAIASLAHTVDGPRYIALAVIGRKAARRTAEPQ